MDKLNERKGFWITVKTSSYVLFLIAFMSVLASPITGESGIAVTFLIVIISVVLHSYSNLRIKAISNEFKEKYIKTEIERLIPNSKFYVTKGFEKDTITRSQLVNLRDRYTSEDLIVGEISSVPFRCADVHIEYDQGDDGAYVTTFQGRFYEFEFNKRFKSNVLLLQPNEYRPFTWLKKVKLESMRFNSMFKTYTDKKYDVFYLLTPHLMEKLQELNVKYDKKIGFSFQDNMLSIAINTGINTFDVVGSEAITSLDVENAIKEIHDIISFVEFLKLDDKYFVD